MAEEIWKPIPDYEGYYEVSSTGRIRSVERIGKSGKGIRKYPSVILKPSLGQWGYEQVCLRKDGEKRTARVNRLVAQTFIPNPDNLPQVNHIDGAKTNNNVENLEWCNASQNMIHCFSNELSDWNTRIRIIETGEEFNSISECARAIGGHISLINACLFGSRKTHKGFHFEVIGDRASQKHKRVKRNNKQIYKSNRNIEYNGEIHSIKEWSEIINIPYHTLEVRYYRGDKGDRLFREVDKR